MSYPRSNRRRARARAEMRSPSLAECLERGREAVLSVGGLMLWALVHAPLGQRAHRATLELATDLIDVERLRRTESRRR